MWWMCGEVYIVVGKGRRVGVKFSDGWEDRI